MKKPLFFVLFFCLLSACGSDNEEYGKDIENTYNSIDKYATNNLDMVQSYLDKWAISLNDPIVSQNGSQSVAPNVLSTYNQYVESGEIKESINRHKEIKKEISKLKNPPKEYEKAYTNLLKMQKLYNKTVVLATNPAAYLGNGRAGDYELYYEEALNTSDVYRDINNKTELLIEDTKK
ncbi:hypothetical protein [Priestia megaterium]|uniref:hypothetical protein n=1 Tax=Priestia megaterium TaxID=1404 RepID=UPI002E23A060|nr:hypothetical protein [Priestia megaterium]MED4278293.1 hypothetical protein [Priestia megaterium]MED4314398.1 hypothetical protein [Priestia megaterium]